MKFLLNNLSMLIFIAKHYLVIKTIHLISVISWMAGIFYLPRLFVYHILYPQNSSMLEIMERKLYYMIMQPAMVLSVTSGALLLFNSDLSKGYLHGKLLCVLLLLIFHFSLEHWRKQLLTKTCVKSAKFFRVVNEIPTLLMILIITFIIMRPF